MQKKLMVLVFAAVVCLGIFGCGKGNGKKQVPIRVAFWGSIEEIKIINDTIDAWKSSHPEIKVILQHIPSGFYTDRILTEIAGGNPPDIIFCEVDIFVRFYFKGVLLNLSPYLEKDKNFNIDDFFPEVVARFTRDGKVYCIPRDAAPFGIIFYNKDMFDKEKIPYPESSWNIDDLISIGQKLTYDKNGKRPLDAGFDPKKIDIYGFSGWSMHNFIYSFGGKLVDNVDNPTKCLINQKESMEGLQRFINMSNTYHIAPSPDVLLNAAMSINQLFAMERLAMFQSGIWETPNLRRIVGNKFKWDIAMFPKGPGGKRGFGTGGSGYTILKTTKYPDEAWEVIKCLAGETGQEMLAKTGLAQPANRRISEGPYWAGSAESPANRKMLNEAVKYITYNPFHPSWREAWDKFISPQLDLVFARKKSLKEAMDFAAEKTDELLKNK